MMLVGERRGCRLDRLGRVPVRAVWADGWVVGEADIFSADAMIWCGIRMGVLTDD